MAAELTWKCSAICCVEICFGILKYPFRVAYLIISFCLLVSLGIAFVEFEAISSTFATESSRIDLNIFSWLMMV